MSGEPQARSDEEERQAAAACSPCIGVCVIDVRTDQCWGCRRSRHEIASWVALGDTGRAAVLGRHSDRRASD